MSTLLVLALILFMFLANERTGEIDMTITRIRVSNFKSLVDFTLDFAKFNCLIGLNGSGKSTVLQFFDFISQQMKGDITGWLKQRHWGSADLNSKLTNKKNIDFEITFEIESKRKVVWRASFNRSDLRCTSESVDWEFSSGVSTILKVKKGDYFYHSIASDGTAMGPGEGAVVSFDYEGSILSQLKENRLPAELIRLKQFLEKLHSLEMLAPELLRQKTREAQGSLGLGGERLAAFLHELDAERVEHLSTALKKAYSSFQGLEVKTLRSGWKQLQITELFGSKKLLTESRQVNDGLLRLLAVFSQLTIDQSFLLLDEIENGINPELVEYLIDTLVNASPQVLVTTHSPMILNFLEDEVAKAGVIYLYKGNDGCTRPIRFFDIPSMSKKLTTMGPGEAYEDTNLYELAVEIDSLNERL